MPGPSEAQTRREKIDPLLKEQGLDVTNRSQVVLEVDTKQSNFPLRDYKTVKETLRNDEESKYVDYLLLDSAGAPLAIVEAKRTSKDSHLGQRQAEEYADDIKRQTGKDVLLSSQAYANSAALPNAADTNSNGRIEPVDAPAATNIGSVFCLYGNANFGA